MERDLIIALIAYCQRNDLLSCDSEELVDELLNIGSDFGVTEEEIESLID